MSGDSGITRGRWRGQDRNSAALYFVEDAAAALGVKVHAISILPPGFRQSWIAEDMETVLTAISGFTGGRYFTASSAAELESIYREINWIEAPVPILTESEIRHPLRTRLLLLGLVLLGLDVALRASRWALVP